jgi:hypothetical protein
MPNKTSAASPKTRKTKHIQHEYSPTEANWAALSFPTDPSGLTTKLRREFRDTIQRRRGSDERFHNVLDNLEILMAWAKAKLEADEKANVVSAQAAAARAMQAARREEFRSSIQAGVTIKVSATDTGFIEPSPRNGSILAVYDTAADARGPVVAMAQIMIAEGRDQNSTLEIHAFGRRGIGSGQTLKQLAYAGREVQEPAPQAAGGLQALRVAT